MLGITKFLKELDQSFDKGYMTDSEIKQIKAPALYKIITVFLMKRSADFDYFYKNEKGDKYTYRFHAPKNQRKKLICHFVLRNRHI